MATVTIRNGLNGAVLYDVGVGEASPTTPDGSPSGAGEAINGVVLGSANRFALIGDISAFVPAGATINAAFLYITRTSAGTESHNVVVHRTAYTGWDESTNNTATWNLLTLDTPSTSDTVPTGTVPKAIDITDIVADCFANRSGLLAIVVKNATEDGTNSENLSIRSSQYAVDQTIRPYIEIEYTEAAGGGAAASKRRRYALELP